MGETAVGSENTDSTAGLVVSELCKEFSSAAETLNVLSNVELEMTAGEDISIVGPSGCGKSTFLYILGTLDQPTSGSVALAETDPFQLSAKQLAKFRNDNIGFVFQDHHLLPQLSVVENVLLPALAEGNPSKDSVQRAEELIERVGLERANKSFTRPAKRWRASACSGCQSLAEKAQITSC